MRQDQLVGDGRRTREIFDFIVDFMETSGYVPSTRQIVSGTSVASTSGVNYHVSRLIEAGYLSKPRPFALVVTGGEFRFYGERP
jgi:SOS-response transcriptional repressor LexA